MREYTVLALASVIFTLCLDILLKIRILRHWIFYLYLVIIFWFKLWVNGYLTGENIVLYNRQFFLGIRLGTIPLEDFLFGFSMVTATIIFWEFFKSREGISVER